MRSSVHVPAAVEALLGHPVAALSERRAPRLTRLLLNVTVERSLWPVHVLLGADATVADLACAAVAAYAAEGRRPPLPADDTATDAAARFEWPRQSRHPSSHYSSPSTLNFRVLSNPSTSSLDRHLLIYLSYQSY
ncbi:hypothetical protein VPH35_134751 [Triticum aestivum]